MNSRFLRIAGIALAAGLALTSFTNAASARERLRNGSATGTQGGTAQWSKGVERSPGHRSVDRSRNVTGPEGRSASMNAEHGCTEGAGCSRSIDRTGPNGNTYSHDSSTTRNPDGSVSHTAATSGPQGGSGSTTSNFARTEDGASWSRNKEGTGPNGNSASVDASGQCESGQCGSEVTRTTPNGGSTVSRWVTVE
ncbi:hypothetical protein F2P47_13795 [Parvibaculum sedimenti]|uniref:Uncharacterized protein n=1 Tax=Parvibaculum sedimenti TaxID=2608632 RepID=A0A6N6VGN4_9HYPH|nr:hypothetical protein [Parvibaculum sedimenti]KAB7739079.1 hypothetical protein F2P47_13795 [Parvibaculum sedimenti]